MYYPKKEALEIALNKIKQIEEIAKQLQTIDEEIYELRNDTAVGDLVSFNGKGKSRMVLEDTICELKDDVSEAKKRIELLLSNIDKEHEFETGDILKSMSPVRTLNRYLDVTGTRMFNADTKFFILDRDGANYILKRIESYNDDLLFATKEQLLAFFEHTGEKFYESWVKIEFSLNGIYSKYCHRLSEIKLYADPCTPKGNNGFYYGYNTSHASKLINFTVDEVFGVMGTVYARGNKQNNYNDILFKFGEKFQVGFTQNKNNKEMYKYNGKISHFTKDSGLHGDTYFPKDVFEGKQRERISLIQNVKQIIKFVPEEERGEQYGS